MIHDRSGMKINIYGHDQSIVGNCITHVTADSIYTIFTMIGVNPVQFLGNVIQTRWDPILNLLLAELFWENKSTVIAIDCSYSLARFVNGYNKLHTLIQTDSIQAKMELVDGKVHLIVDSRTIILDSVEETKDTLICHGYNGQRISFRVQSKQ